MNTMTTAFAPSVPASTSTRSAFLASSSCRASAHPSRTADPARARTARATPLRMMAAAGGKPPKMPDEAKAAVARGESVKYWEGEWICVDCGYIYKPGRRIKFEDLASTWKCPQCNAPKRRFAKKAGDYIAETSGTSNLPIIVFSVVGLLATVGFGIWASTQL